MIKLVNFLQNLQTLNTSLNNFSETLFRSFVLFMYLKLKKQNKYLILKVVKYLFHLLLIIVK